MRRVARGVAGWVRRVIASRLYVPVSLASLLLLLGGIGVAGAVSLGAWPPAALQSHAAIVITSPVATGDGAPRIQGYVLGAVRTPGVYALAADGRVRDLIEAAGGPLDDADLTRVDLAAHVADGEQVYVPRVGEQVPVTQGARVNLNTATAQDLHNALGIGLVTARKIVSYRAAHGNFTAVSQLLLVPVSKTIYDRIKALVTV